MNIVVLDGYTSNPGDIAWYELESIGTCRIYDSSAHDEVAERCRNAEIVLTNKTALNAETLACLPELRYIGVLATGYNVVDVPAATVRGNHRCQCPGVQHGLCGADGFCPYSEFVQ